MGMGRVRLGLWKSLNGHIHSSTSYIDDCLHMMIHNMEYMVHLHVNQHK